MVIKGIIAIKPEVMDLSKFFDGVKASVTIRPLPATTRAKIQELTSNGVRYATRQQRKKLDIEAIEQAMPAETTMEIRDLKLEQGVVESFIPGSDDKGLPWSKELWDALDEANPLILQKVVERITEISYPEDEEGEEEDPTSPAKRGKK